VKRFLLWSALAVAAGIIHNYATVWYCTEGAFAELLQTGPTWLMRVINYAFFFPCLFLYRFGLGPGTSLRVYFAVNSVVWTVSFAAFTFCGWRLLTWWSVARRRKMAS
jgi:hypothetical protein